jgi:hypothetical protein
MTTPKAAGAAAAGPGRQDEYNYPAFSFALVGDWLTEGPKPGEIAPGFRLDAVDGTTISLDELRGRPVVVEFGSYTCPIFYAHIEPMEAIVRHHPEAAFLVVYTREAHPGEIVPAHRTIQDKREAARRLVASEPIRRAVLIDDLEGTVHRAYGAAWDSAYVIDENGLVVLRQAWANPADVDAVLADLAAGSSVVSRQTTGMAPVTGGPRGESLLRGGTQALLDFYTTAPAPLRRQLRQSPSQVVRSVLLDLDGTDPPPDPGPNLDGQ